MNAQRITTRNRLCHAGLTRHRLCLMLAIAIDIILMATILLASPAHAQEALPTISTDRPGQTISPAIVLPGHIQMELGAQLASDGPGGGANMLRLSAPQGLVRIGLLPTMELRLQGELRMVTTPVAGGSDQSRRGLAGVAVGTKVGITREDGAIPEMALGVTLALPLGERGYRPRSVAPSFSMAARSGLSPTLNLYYNLGAGWDGTNGAGAGSYSVALWNGFSGTVSGFAELYGSLATGAGPLHAADAGMAWLPASDLQLDISGGTGITPNAPDYFVSAGISLDLPR